MTDYINELSAFHPHAERLGIVLDESQPHVMGERVLMSAGKLVLLGRLKDRRVVIKASREQRGSEELEREHHSRETLKKIDFAYRVFLIPEELRWERNREWTVAITEYVEQSTPFLARPLREQFSLILRAFKLQESIHAATYAHAKAIRDAFGFWGAKTYTRFFSRFRSRIQKNTPNFPQTIAAMDRARKELDTHTEDIERYCGFLTHADFALQNIRVTENDIYLIDLASLRFGNKFESWARFLNFMLLYNRPLERALVTYVESNRSEEEQTSLRLMRIFKIGELLAYYATAYARSEGNLRALSEARLKFWTHVLTSLLDNTSLSDESVEEYKKVRDALRSDAEKVRQKELQQL